MAWFFAESVSKPVHIIAGEDALHITKSLRMSVGERLTVCDSSAVAHDCEIVSVNSADEVLVRVLSSGACENEPAARVTLYQALPKGDKFDSVVQKSVELGVSEIVPIITSRCVSRPNETAAKKKVLRWNKIARQAAMQSRRGIIPTVQPVLSFSEALRRSAGTRGVICYECGGKRLSEILCSDDKEISLFIGSEGGFEESEIRLAQENGAAAATLGKRILRAETAPLAALSVIMFLTGNF